MNLELEASSDTSPPPTSAVAFTIIRTPFIRDFAGRPFLAARVPQADADSRIDRRRMRVDMIWNEDEDMDMLLFEVVKEVMENVEVL